MFLAAHYLDGEKSRTPSPACGRLQYLEGLRLKGCKWVTNSYAS